MSEIKIEIVLPNIHVQKILETSNLLDSSVPF